MSELALEIEARYWMMFVKIDNRWAVADFSQFFGFIERYHHWYTAYDNSLFYVLSAIRVNPTPQVISIQYGSPGSINILGLGEVMKHLKELFMYLMDRDQVRRQKDLDLERAFFRLKQEEIDYAIKLLKKAKGYKRDVPKEVIEKFIEESGLKEVVTMIHDSRITEIEIREEK